MGRREPIRAGGLARAVRLLANAAVVAGLVLAIGSLMGGSSSAGVPCWTGLSLAAVGLLLREAQTGFRTARRPR